LEDIEMINDMDSSPLDDELTPLFPEVTIHHVASDSANTSRKIKPFKFLAISITVLAKISLNDKYNCSNCIHFDIT
jgi:hypothetical protein